MERLQSQLFEAATRGDVSSLLQLLLIDPLLLERDIRYHNSETALHVSALKGHPDFVKEIIGIKPELTNDLNSQGSSPLHLASAKGHVNVVSVLLSNPTMCLARDKDGLTPLHLAAVKGQVAVMELLLKAKPEAARLTLYGGETILHFCVKNWQLEALKLLVSSVSDPEFVKCKDGEGNTLLHLAVEYKQVETIKLLVNNGAANEVDVNAVNHKGLTAMDILIRSRSDVRDSEIRESLNRAAAGGAAGASMGDRRIHDEQSWVKHILKFENSIMVMASVIAAMAFQVALYPPGGLWQDDNYLLDKAGKMVDPLGNRISHAVDSQNRTVLNPHRAGHSILATNYYDLLHHLYELNTVAYCSSLSIILLVVSGFSSKNEICAWILLLAAELAILTALFTYDVLVMAWIPSNDDSKTIKPYVTTVMIFLFLICMSAKCLNFWIRSRRRSRAASSAVPVGDNNTSVV